MTSPAGSAFHVIHPMQEHQPMPPRGPTSWEQRVDAQLQQAQQSADYSNQETMQADLEKLQLTVSILNSQCERLKDSDTQEDHILEEFSGSEFDDVVEEFNGRARSANQIVEEFVNQPVTGLVDDMIVVEGRSSPFMAGSQFARNKLRKSSRSAGRHCAERTSTFKRLPRIPIHKYLGTALRSSGNELGEHSEEPATSASQQLLTLPLVNRMMDGIHRTAGNEMSWSSADTTTSQLGQPMRSEEPAMMKLPLVNRMMDGIHRTAGNEMNLSTADTKTSQLEQPMRSEDDPTVDVVCLSQASRLPLGPDTSPFPRRPKYKNKGSFKSADF